MKKFVLTLLFVFLTGLSVSAQTPDPTATPVSAEDDDVVKISTNLIQVDVTVTDSKGNIVKDLNAEDFEIYENGKKQDITNFSFISAGSRSTQQIAEKTTDKTGVPLPPKRVRPEQVRRTIALVVDDLTLSFESTHFVRRALKKFVDEQMEDGDLVAIIRTGAGIGALQQFTTDKRLLYAAIEKVKWNMTGSGGIGAFAPIESNLQNQTASGEEDSEEEEEERDSLAELNEFRESVFATGTLGAINFIVRGMKDLPGRKSVMLLSDGFSLFTQTTDGFRDSSRVYDSLRRLVDLANRSSVVVYTMDARGLVVTGITAADDVSGLSPQQIESQISQRRDKIFNTQEGLTYLARQTGGFPILNNNDISRGIRRVLDDQSYYLIGYQPDAETFDPAKRRFNSLEIKVKRKDVKVRYRSGFFGISDENIQRPANLTPMQQLESALTSPFGVSDINLSLNTMFAADTKYNSALSSFLYIDLKDLKFSDSAEGKKAVFDVIAVSFGDNGAVVDQISKTYTINVKEEVFKEMLKENFVYFFTFPVKKPGAYQMRVAIRDHGSEKLGSASQFIEVPKLSKKRLTLSGIVLESLTFDQWSNEEKTNVKVPTNPMADTALRIFRRGTVLRYGFEIYNAKQQNAQKPQLQTQWRMFRDGKIIYESKLSPVDLTGQTDLRVIKSAGALSLGTSMQNGDYVLQIIITDTLAKKKSQIASQFVQFEIVD